MSGLEVAVSGVVDRRNDAAVGLVAVDVAVDVAVVELGREGGKTKAGRAAARREGSPRAGKRRAGARMRTATTKSGRASRKRERERLVASARMADVRTLLSVTVISGQ